MKKIIRKFKLTSTAITTQQFNSEAKTVTEKMTSVTTDYGNRFFKISCSRHLKLKTLLNQTYISNLKIT